MLTRSSLAAAARDLGRRDPDLGLVLALHGLPPLWARRPGFATLVRIILEQQVSLASGRAAYVRVAKRLGRVTPDRVVGLGEDRLRGTGLTRQKARYLRELAVAITAGRLDLRRVARLDDKEARRALTAVTGIGPWTAEIYLLMALRRRDVWPSGDLALAKAVQVLRHLPRLPPTETLDKIADRWRPYRAVGARLLWHYYLNGFGQIETDRGVSRPTERP